MRDILFTFLIEFFNVLLGDHALAVWSAGMVWTVIGILAVKIYHYNASNSFSLKYWINDNAKDVLLGLFVSLIFLRLGDLAVHLLQERVWPTMPDTQNIVGLMILVSGLVQYKLHKSRKPISVGIKQEMHVHNNDCNH